MKNKSVVMHGKEMIAAVRNSTLMLTQHDESTW